jgi:hypothetical protein
VFFLGGFLGFFGLGGFFICQPCLVVRPGLLARDERVHRHHAGLVLRAHEHVLLVRLLQEQQHVTVVRQGIRELST